MTPLLRFLLRFMPEVAARLALSMIYAMLIVGILATIASRPPNVLYVDVPDLQTGLGISGR